MKNEALECNKAKLEKLQEIKKSNMPDTKKVNSAKLIFESPDISVDTAIEFSEFDMRRAYEVLVVENNLLSDTDFCDMIGIDRRELDLDYIETDITDEDIIRLRRKKNLSEREQELIDAIFADLKSGQCEHYNAVIDEYCVDPEDNYNDIDWDHHAVKILRLAISVYGDILDYKFNDEIAYELGFVDDNDDGDYDRLCKFLKSRENQWVLNGSECTR